MTPNHIQAPSAHPGLRAQQVQRDRGDELLAELAAKAALATELRVPLVEREQALDGLVEFCTRRVVQHLLATDRVLYSVAAGTAETRLLVRSLRAQHDLVASRIADVQRADGSEAVAASVHVLIGVLQVCLHAEQEVLVPALAALPGIDLPALVDDTGVLLAGGVLDPPAELDVREIPRDRRHPRIFGAYARLAPGESFVLVNNHDPKPLRREFQNTYPDQFGWDYLEAGPQRWRVRIGRLPVGA